MKKARRISALLCAFAITLTCASATSEAISQSELTIGAAEYSAVTAAMEMREMGNSITTEILYDHNGEPSYILGLSDCGYLIMDRATHICIEGGSVNPYWEYPTAQKYYGGPGLYYVEEGTKFYDIVKNNAVDTLSYFTALSNLKAVQQRSDAENVLAAEVEQPEDEKIPDYEEDILKQAFGYNDDNTCTAVACAIILNYLDRHSNDLIVNSNVEAESLTEKPVNASETQELYPNAYGLHRFLVENCKMGAATHTAFVENGIDRYREYNPDVAPSEISVTWDANIWNDWAIEDIKNERPSMLTSTIAGDYSFHTMVIYGYHRYTDGTLDYYVHTGWYSDLEKDGTNYTMPEKWVNCTVATFLYRFTNV